MKIKQRFTGFILTAVMIVALFAAIPGITVSATVYGGNCGNNLTWQVDTDERVLTIYGTGEMWNWASPSSVPWYNYSPYISTVNISNNLTSIGDLAFYNFNNLESVTIPASVTKIGERAFDWCNNLTSINIPQNVKAIWPNSFLNCAKLTSINVDSSNQYYANYNNDGVLYDKTITTLFHYPQGKSGAIIMPDSITRIESYAFYSYSSLTSVTIPHRVTHIGSYAFQNCSNLSEITIPDSVTSIGSDAFRYCSSLIEITIPDNVTAIGSYTFENCGSLTSVTIPDSVTYIGYYAFRYCGNLTSVSIPDSVINIQDYAFASCYKLASVTFEGNVPTSFGLYVFSDTAPVTIYYYEDKTGWTTPNWKGYKTEMICNRVEDSGTITTAPTCQANGVMTFKCVHCNEILRTETISIDPDNHIGETREKIITAATYETDGSMGIYCADCDKLLNTKVIPKMICSHDYKGVIITPANCATMGVKTFTCSKCGDIYTEPVEIDPDNHIGETCEKVIIAATYETDGSMGIYCADCDKLLNIKVIPKLIRSGDVNGDNKVNIIDLITLARHLAGVEKITDSELLEAAKVNGDDDISMLDLIRLAKYIAEIDTSSLGTKIK